MLVNILNSNSCRNLRMKSGHEQRTRPEATTVILGIGIGVLRLLALWPVGRAVPEDSDIVAVSFSSAGEALLAGTRGGEVFLLNVHDGSVVGSWHMRRSWLDQMGGDRKGTEMRLFPSHFMWFAKTVAQSSCCFKPASRTSSTELLAVRGKDPSESASTQPR